MPPHNPPTALVILAGGQAKRMKTPTQKCLIPINGKTILNHTLERLNPKTFCATAVNTNTPTALQSHIPQTLTTFPDRNPEASWGPLAGLLASMDWAQSLNATWILSVPGDCPFLPRNLLTRLRQTQTQTNTEIVCAASNHQIHPIIALWNITLRESLEQALYCNSIRKIDAWTAKHKTATAHWNETPDPFFNVNTPEDIKQAETIASNTTENK